MGSKGPRPFAGGALIDYLYPIFGFPAAIQALYSDFVRSVAG